MKVVWVASGPNNIYLNFFEGLVRYHQDIEPVLIVGKEKKNSKDRVDYNRTVNFRLIELDKQMPKLNYLVFWPIVLKNMLKRLPAGTDMPTLVNLKNLEKTLEEENPDVVISTTHFKPYSTQAYKYCMKSGAKFVLQNEFKGHPKGFLMAFMSRMSVLFKSRLFKNSDAILTWSSLAKDWQSEYPIDEDKIENIIPAYDDSRFYPVDVEKDYSNLRALFVGRLVPYKRPMDAVKAIEELITQWGMRNVSLTILGSGPLEKEVKKYIKKHDLGDYVKFHDKVPQENLKEIYAQHDVLILPSYNEELGMVVVEAMACGCPALVSNTCGAADYVVNNVNGFIYKTGDIDQMATRLYELKPKSIRQQMSKLSKLKAKELFSIEPTSNHFSQFIRDLKLLGDKNCENQRGGEE